MKRILFVIGELDIGGTEIQLLNLVKVINRSSFDIGIVCLNQNTQLVDDFFRSNCKVFEINNRSNKFIKLKNFYKIMKLYKPNIIYSFGYAGRITLPFMLWQKDPKYICGIRTIPFQGNYFENLIDKVMYLFVNFIVANSEAALNALPKFIKSKPNHCRVIHNGLDFKEFENIQKKCLSFNYPKILPNEIVICAIANLTPVKQLDKLLEAFSYLLINQNNLYLWIVGNGPLLPSLEKLSVQLKINNNIKFLGHRKDIPKILSLVSIGVNCSARESISNSILEYMAASLPVVATSVGGNPELIRHGFNGILVDPNDSKELSTAIQYLLDNPTIANKMGKAGRDLVKEKFSMQKLKTDTELLFNEL